MASGDVIEVVPGQVYRGATDFSEFPLQAGVAVPAGLTAVDLSVPAEMDFFAIADDPDPDVGRYFQATAAGGGNQFSFFGIDSFFQTPNQDIIEIVGRIRTPLDTSFNSGWGGFMFAGDTGQWHHVACADDGLPPATFDILAGLESSSIFIRDSVVERQTGEWMWVRYRRARDSIGSGPVNVRVKLWYGAFDEEPAAWLWEQLGVVVNSGPFIDEHIGLDAALIMLNNRVYAWSYLSFTTGVSEDDLDTYPPLTPTQLAGGWMPPDPPPNTAWAECGPSLEYTLALQSTGLVFRDQFARADAQALGNGWTDWESVATQIQIVGQEVVAAGVTQKTGGSRPAGEVTGSQTIMAQMNMRPNGQQLCGVKIRWNGGLGTGYHFRMDARSGGSWQIVKNDSSVLSNTTTAPRPLPNEWRGIRAVVEGTSLRHYATGVLANGQDLSLDLVSVGSAVDGSVITSQNRTGFEKDQLNISANYDEFFVCGITITVTGVPTGHKIQVDGRAAVTESGGTVTINVETWALPATTIKLLDPSDVELATLTPVGGVWGGDTYDITSSGGGVPNTTWEEC